MSLADCHFDPLSRGGTSSMFWKCFFDGSHISEENEEIKFHIKLKIK